MRGAARGVGLIGPGVGCGDDGLREEAAGEDEDEDGQQAEEQHLFDVRAAVCSTAAVRGALTCTTAVVASALKDRGADGTASSA